MAEPSYEEIEKAWEANLDHLEAAGYTRTDTTEWERNFWEEGYKQGRRESGGSDNA